MMDCNAATRNVPPWFVWGRGVGNTAADCREYHSRGDRYLGYTQAESVPVTNFPCKDFVMHKNGKVCKNGRFIDY